MVLNSAILKVIARYALFLFKLFLSYLNIYSRASVIGLTIWDSLDKAIYHC